MNLHYKRQLDTAFTSAGVSLKKLVRKATVGDRTA